MKVEHHNRIDWYLTHWKGFVVNYPLLDKRTKILADLFFISLNQLDEKEVQFLKEKYHTENASRCNTITGLVDRYKPRSDQVMAEALGVDEKNYMTIRLRIRNKLNQALQNEIAKHNDAC